MPKKPKKSDRKPDPTTKKLTTGQAASRLFPRPILDSVRQDLDLPLIPTMPVSPRKKA